MLLLDIHGKWVQGGFPVWFPPEVSFWESSLGCMLDPCLIQSRCHRFTPTGLGSYRRVTGRGKFRLITHLSFPLGSRINDGIDPSLCSMAYITVDEVASQVGQGGHRESAYRLLPVHPQDRHLQASTHGRARAMLIPCYHLGHLGPGPRPKYLMQ